MVDELYEKAWLPMRNHFTPVMKLVGKERIGTKIRKSYDKPATPCDRLLACPKVNDEVKETLRQTRANLDPLSLAEEVEQRLSEIFKLVERIEEERWEEMERAGEHPGGASGVLDFVTAVVAPAPTACTTSSSPEELVKAPRNNHKTNNRRVL